MDLRVILIIGLLANFSLATPLQNSVAARSTDFITEKVLALMEKLKGDMKEGVPEHNIPPLDPLRINGVSLGPLKIGNIGKLDVAKFDKVQVNGLPNFNVENLKTNIFSMELNMTLHFPLLSADGDYEIDGIIKSLFPVYGKGPFQIYTRDVRAGGKAKLVAKDGRISLKTLKLHSSIGRLDVDIKGLLGGGDLGAQMNKLIHSGAQRLIEDLKPKMSDMISEFVRLRLNDGLKDVDVGSIVG